MSTDRHVPEGRCCVTGVAGFIGSHLLEALLQAGREVVGFDNLSTGRRGNLDEVKSRVPRDAWDRFHFIEGDIRHTAEVRAAVAGANVVFHQAALVSVPQSLREPILAHAVNVEGFLNVLEAARLGGVARVVYASSSAVYGDLASLPAREDQLGLPRSPYALTKRIGEVCASWSERAGGVPCVGLRYFNVFGPRQDARGAYSAVLPRWIEAWFRDEPVTVFGDGSDTRDFCPVDRVVEANLRAASSVLPAEAPRVFNVGSGRALPMLEVATLVQKMAAQHHPAAAGRPIVMGPAREGDIAHSCADVDLASRWLGWRCGDVFREGLQEMVEWFWRVRQYPQK